MGIREAEAERWDAPAEEDEDTVREGAPAAAEA